MGKLLGTVLLVGILGVAACGGGGGGGDGGTVVWHVDAATGSDANPGTAEAPFRSITRGLASAQPGPSSGSGDVVRVFPGTYDAAVETFPLIVPAGVVLEANPFSSVPLVVGGGPVPAQYGSGFTASVVVPGDAMVAGLDFHNPLTAVDPGFHYGAVVNGDEARIASCFFRASRDGGIRVESGANVSITRTNIYQHATGVGLHFAGGGVGGRVQFCNIHDNRIGVEYDAPGAVLNGATLAEGRVQIYGNTDTDVWVAPGLVVNARGCAWDHVPPMLSTADVGGGIDIFHLDGPSGIDATGAGTVEI